MVLDWAAEGSWNVCWRPCTYLFSHKSLVFCCVSHGRTQRGSNQSPSPLLSLLCVLTHFRLLKQTRPLDILVTRMAKNPCGIPRSLSTSRAVFQVRIVTHCSMGKSLVMGSYAWLADKQTDEVTAVVSLMCCDMNWKWPCATWVTQSSLGVLL